MYVLYISPSTVVSVTGAFMYLSNTKNLSAYHTKRIASLKGCYYEWLLSPSSEKI